MMTLPAVNPVTVPDPLTVATAAGLLLHEPPPVISDNVVVAPLAQTLSVPVMATGNGFTVIVAVAGAPQPVVYVMSVLPGAIPDTIPDVLFILA